MNYKRALPMNCKKYLFYLCFALIAISCNESARSQDSSHVTTNLGEALPYNLEKPANKFLLINNLKEISGLSYSDSINQLIAINDEKAKIYFLDTLEGKSQNRIDFGKADDYEGISYVDGMIFVAESNGNLKLINEATGKKEKEYKSNLSRKNDIEGLTYLRSQNLLLLTAKAKNANDKLGPKVKSIFKFDLNTMSFVKDVSIDIDLLAAFDSLALNLSTAEQVRLRKRVQKFSPSGIAQHPISSDLYILSSRGKLLVVTDLVGQIKTINFLPIQQHAQPEGICFSNTNSLYIANEGRASKGKIYKFLTNTD